MASTDINGRPVVILNEEEAEFVKHVLFELYPFPHHEKYKRILKKIKDMQAEAARIDQKVYSRPFVDNFNGERDY